MNTLSMHRSVWVVVGALTSAAAGLLAIFWSCDPAVWACLTVERLATVVTILSLTISPGLYFAKQRYSDKAEGERAATAAYMELADAYDALDSNAYRDVRSVTLPDQTTVYFMSRLFNHDVYDSLVNSGKITFIDADLQQLIQDAFQRVKDHNGLLRRVREMQEEGGDSPHAYHLYSSLSDADDDLLGHIPKIMRKIEAKYGMG